MVYDPNRIKERGLWFTKVNWISYGPIRPIKDKLVHFRFIRPKKVKSHESGSNESPFKSCKRKIVKLEVYWPIRPNKEILVHNGLKLGFLGFPILC